MIFLIMVLVAAAVFSGLLGNWNDVFIIGIILAFNQTLDAFHRWKTWRILTQVNKLAGHDVYEVDSTVKIHSARRAHKIVAWITGIITGLIVCVLVFAWYAHLFSYDLVLGLMAFLVAVVPESLPLVITALLLRHAVELARGGLVIRRLHAIEQFGGAQVLLLDAHSRTQCCDAPNIAANAAALNMRIIVEPNEQIDHERVVAVSDRSVDADVTIAWATNGADGVLTGSSCAAIEHAIISGRRACAAIRRVFLYLFSCNLAEALIVLLALLCGQPFPLTAVQLLWVNVLTDGLMDMALIHERDERLPMQPVHITTPNLIVHIVLLAVVQVASCLTVFYLCMPRGLVYARTMVLLTVIGAQWFNAWNCRSEYSNVFKLNVRLNYWLVVETVALVVLQIIIFTVAPLRTLFGLVPLDFADVILSTMAASSVLFIGQLYVFLKCIRE